MPARNSSLARFFEVSAELVQQRRFRVAVVLFLLGTAALIGSYLFESEPARVTIISFVVSSLGAALVVTAVAEFVLLEHASRAMRQQLEETMDQLRRDFAIVTHSIENGLTDVLSPRRGDPSETSVVRTLSSILRDARGELRISGFSLREFLDGGQPLYAIIQSLLRNDEPVNVRMLLIDPISEAARLRTMVEQGPLVVHTQGAVFSDVVASISAIEFIVEAARGRSRFSFEARFCNLNPPFYMVATSETLFLEPYHLGRVPGDPPCIGGFVPVLRFRAGCQMYQRALLHFDYIWNSCEQLADVEGEPDRETWVDGRILKTRTLQQVLETLERMRPREAAV